MPNAQSQTSPASQAASSNEKVTGTEIVTTYKPSPNALSVTQASWTDRQRARNRTADGCDMGGYDWLS